MAPALVIVERPSAATADRLLVLLPGYGDEPDLLLDRLALIDPERRWHVAVARPPRTTSIGPAWYTVDSDGPDAAQLAEAVAALDAGLAGLTGRLGLDPHAVVVAGFSQGGAWPWPPWSIRRSRSDRAQRRDWPATSLTETPTSISAWPPDVPC